MLANQRRVQGRTATGQWGTVSGEESAAAVTIPPEELVAITRRLDELDKNHQRAIGRFTEQLPAQVRGLSVCAQQLSMVAHGGGGGQGAAITDGVDEWDKEPSAGNWGSSP